jgi:molecular chaperone HtpG
MGWFNGLSASEHGRDFLARTKRMSADERDRFFFQEYIRRGHAARIREWITGRFTSRWPSGFEAAANAVHTLLTPLPTRFREYLAAVCESHHSDSLDDARQFPSFAPVGKAITTESVNVQYAALILRTADLLHVTNDRTPSREFSLIRFTDPKSVEEWVKQMGTFAVGPKTRAVDPNDPESTRIFVYADFEEERPFFSLQEYIVYANQQVAQSRRWAAKSEGTRDGAQYRFPWTGVTSDVRFQGAQPEQLKFELDRGKLLDLLVGHMLYNDPTVAIRELLQNAIDAVRYQYHNDLRISASNVSHCVMGGVTVTWDPATRTLSVQDNGIGMDLDTIHNHLLMVGSSFYDTPRFRAEHADFTPISRFGIGVLTCFMVSDDIEIVTRRDTKAYRIRMTAVEAAYILHELPEHDSRLSGLERHGTRVTLTIRDSVDLSSRSVADILAYWIILPECRVEYREPDGTSHSIGFSTPVQALEHYLRTANPDKRRIRSNLECVTKVRRGGDSSPQALYELAIAVHRGWFPEKMFMSPFQRQPMVCVEGIRVSDALPWLDGGRDELCGLLSVRGNRDVRTTVSRAGLEEDDAYSELGRLCLDLVVEHIRDEVKRITDLPGSPLSEAASACDVLWDRVIEALSGKGAIERAEEVERTLPIVVVERSEDGAAIATRRSIVSIEQLQNEEALWTVESRLVRSLKVLSDDLGRELGINESLTMLAPGFDGLRYSLLVLDAERVEQALLRSYQVVRLECSRKYRQIVMEWRKVEPKERAFQVGLLPPDLLSEIRRYMAQNETALGMGDVTWIAPLVGSGITETVGLTNMGVVFSPASEVAREWEAICYAAQHYADLGDIESCALVVIAAGAHRVLRLGGESRSRGPSAERFWEKGVELIRGAMGVSGNQATLPAELTRIPYESIFDVRSFWRNRHDAYDE